MGTNKLGGHKFDLSKWSKAQLNRHKLGNLSGVSSLSSMSKRCGFFERITYRGRDWWIYRILMTASILKFRRSKRKGVIDGDGIKQKMGGFFLVYM